MCRAERTARAGCADTDADADDRHRRRQNTGSKQAGRQDPFRLPAGPPDRTCLEHYFLLGDQGTMSVLVTNRSGPPAAVGKEDTI